MNRKERVIAAIQKKPVDRVPASFSLHFPADIQKGQAAVDAHISFLNETGCDILKIMNENLVPPIGEMNGPEDWDQVPAHTKSSPFIQEQLELTKRTLEAAKENVFSLATIHGICASTIHPIEPRYGYVPVREMLCEHLRANPAPVLAAMARIADVLCELVRESAALGVDGIYYAALGAEHHFFTDEEFATWIEPYDLRILKAAKEAGLYNFLHICKENLNVQRYANYGELVDVVNWGVYETDFSLDEGRKLFPNATIMGGLANRSGVLVDGSHEEIRDAVRKIIKDFGTTGFILGADCTLPTEIPYDRIKAAVEAVV
ncbi:MAG TPA: uroporphyrinogen III decarboxylase [Firmicutes bacterium]|jgi:uroporphyrinogen decarboxylase|nr:uroporphyrinogen III decarboxylase [Bacillota bacterium]